MKVKKIIRSIAKAIDITTLIFLFITWGVLINFGSVGALLFLILWFVVEDEVPNIKMFFRKTRRKKFDEIKLKCTHDAFLIVKESKEIPISDLRAKLEKQGYRKDVILAALKELIISPLVWYQDLSLSLREENEE